MRQADPLVLAQTLNMGKEVCLFSSVRLNFNSPFQTRDLPSVLELESNNLRSNCLSIKSNCITRAHVRPFNNYIILVLTPIIVFSLVGVFVQGMTFLQRQKRCLLVNGGGRLD